MNNLFKTEIYIHMIIVFVLMLYALTTSIYILFNDDYNIFIRILSIIIISIIIFLSLKKETFLPFLGLTFLPNTLICDPKYPQGANLNYSIDINKLYSGSSTEYFLYIEKCFL